jgi:hypothetical protein
MAITLTEILSKFRPIDIGHAISKNPSISGDDSIESCPLRLPEHLRPLVARSFLESLVRHGDTILFSAAIPGQGGTGHVNEQWSSYWADLFAEHDYRPLNALRGALWDAHDVEPWYRQNCLLLVSGGDPRDLVLQP